MIIIIIIMIIIRTTPAPPPPGQPSPRLSLRRYQDSSKGGAVETGCSGLHYIIGCCIIYYYPHPLHPPPTAPPFDEYPR